MADPSWARVKEVLDAALDRPPVERTEFVLGMCGHDRALLAEVQSLLAAMEQAGTFIEQPALQSIAPSAGLSVGGTLDFARRVLDPGDSLGPYEVLEFLGAGGMGEVYRARDGKLNRDVALKVRSEPFAPDSDHLARFKREAHVLASLNHPNIAAIYGLEESTGVPALVLELVEGPTLADRIARGAIPIERGAFDRDANRGRAESGARARDSPSRPETVQHQGALRQHDQDSGFWAGEGVRAFRFRCRRSRSGRNHESRHDSRGHDLRHGRLHEPGASARKNGRQSQ